MQVLGSIAWECGLRKPLCLQRCKPSIDEISLGYIPYANCLPPYVRLFSSTFIPSAQGFSEFRHLNRFADIVIHTGRNELFPIAPQCTGGDCDNMNRRLSRNVRTQALPFPPTNLHRCLDSTHDRHLAVHKDDVKTVLLERLYGFLSVRNDNRIVPEFSQLGSGQPLVDDVVFGQKDSCGDFR